MGRTISNEWVLSLKLRSHSYVDYSSQIGRKELGEEDKDNLDVPALPAMESFVAVRTEINGNGKLNGMLSYFTVVHVHVAWTFSSNLILVMAMESPAAAARRREQIGYDWGELSARRHVQ